MSKVNHLSLKSKVAYILSSFFKKLIADKEVRDTIVNFFITRDCKEVAICNASNISIALIGFFQKNHIDVKYIIDETSENNFSGCRVYKKNRWNIPNVEAVIVCPPPNSKKHKNTRIRLDIEALDKYVSCPVYSVFDLFKKSSQIKQIKKNYMFYRDLDPGYYKAELCSWYKKRTGHELNIDNPKTFEDKLNWLKLYDCTDIKCRLSDKYAVRQWVKETIGDKYLIPLLGLYENPYDIEYDGLPNEFVIKCNHGSGMNIIVNDKTKIDKNEIAEKLNLWLSQNYAFRHGAGFELTYRNIIPKIIIEKKIENVGCGELFDYKFWCFDGVVRYIQFIHDRKSGQIKNPFFNTKWEKQNFSVNCPLELLKDVNPERPDNLDLMIDIAQKLSSGFKYVRTDLYRLNDGEIFFGEMTFYPSIGVFRWSDESVNRSIGDLLKI